MKVKTDISELRLIWSPGEGYFVGREYWNARQNRYEVWAKASMSFYQSKGEAQDCLKALVQGLHDVTLAEATAVGVYMDIMKYGGRDCDHFAVFNALTVEEGVTDHRFHEGRRIA
jgi:hypothetical protein